MGLDDSHYTAYRDAEIELLWARLNALEKRVNDSKIMMRRPGESIYERLVDVVCDHEERLNSLGG